MSRAYSRIKEIEEKWEMGPYFYPNHKDHPSLIRYWWYEEPGHICFKNRVQKALWMALLGQLSDGLWENRNVDWKFWFMLEPWVDGNLGWRVVGDYIPYGEWPVDFYELDDILYGEYLEIAKHFSEREDYAIDDFNKDLEDIMESMGKSLRKIGYLEP